jgi:hypothetical protein
MSEFCTEQRIRSALLAIKESSLRGWEKWIQIEFSLFLKQHADIDDWEKEYQYLLDGRKNECIKAFVDFSFRKKNTNRDLRIALEFKAIDRLTTCIDEMVKDWEKINCVRKSDDDMRSFWVVGFHQTGEMAPEKIEEVVLERLDTKHSCQLYRNRLKTVLVGESGFAFTVF